MPTFRRVDPVVAWPPKRASGSLPNDPETCEHRRWSPVVNLRTGQMTGESACWYCGVKRP